MQSDIVIITIPPYFTCFVMLFLGKISILPASNFINREGGISLAMHDCGVVPKLCLEILTTLIDM